MKILKTILLIALVFFLQVAVAPNISIYSFFPNFILILVVFYLLNFNYSEALISAGVGGILLDLYSPMYFGIYTFGFLLIYFLAYFIFNKFISEQIFIVVFLSFFVGSLVVEMIPFFTNQGFYVTYFSSALYSAILGVIVYYIFSARFKKSESVYKISDKL